MKTVGYYAICTSDQSSGVYKKLNGFVMAAMKLGYLASLRQVDEGHFSHLKLTKAVAFANEDVIVVRGNSYGFFVLMVGLIVARVRGIRIVLDIATPMTVVIHEIKNSNSTVLKKAAKFVGWILSGPWSYWAAHRIVQYAPESMWFSLGSDYKTILIGNGIDVASIPMRTMRPTWPSSELRLVAVAQLSNWHGYDRVIRAINEFNKRINSKFVIFFTIVGTGDEYHNLSNLTKTLGIEDRVIFTGSLQGSKLYEKYAESHFAVSSLGLHRIGLKCSSVLKAREYCAIGIPFLCTGVDPDFADELSFRYVVNSDDDFSEITDFFEKLESVVLIEDVDLIRAFAERNLDIEIKVRSFLEV